MEGKSFFDKMGSLRMMGSLHGSVEIILEHGLVIGMHAVRDNFLDLLSRGLDAQIRDTLLGNNEIHIVSAMIHMRAHGND